MPTKLEGLDRVARYLIQQVAEKSNLTEDQVYDIYESQFAFARDIIQELDFDIVKTEEDMVNMRNSFYFPRLLKLHPNFKILTNLRKKIDDKRKKARS